jgi:thiamine biosynthesis lipoprotein
MRITGYAASEDKAKQACRAAFDRTEQLEQIMSDYRPTSELMRLCAAPPKTWHPISSDLQRVLARGQAVADLSRGAFDMTVGPVVKLWRQARKAATLPLPSEVRETKARTGWSKLSLKPGQARLSQPGMGLDLGGIAKGDALDQAALTLRQKGVRTALIELGGDLFALGAPPGKKGWTIEVAGTKYKVELKDQAMSTSGDTEQFIEFRGQRYSHIVDPRTGYGLTNRRLVSVIARNGLTTDPLSKVLSVLGPAQASTILEHYGAVGIVHRHVE